MFKLESIQDLKDDIDGFCNLDLDTQLIYLISNSKENARDITSALVTALNYSLDQVNNSKAMLNDFEIQLKMMKSQRDSIRRMNHEPN